MRHVPIFAYTVHPMPADHTISILAALLRIQELLTGKQVIDAARGRGLEGLADWMRPKLSNPEQVR